MRYVLVGKRNKRYDYFLKACQEKGMDLQFYDIEDDFLVSKLCENDIVKLDPIANDSIYIHCLEKDIRVYQGLLEDLSNIKNIHFMNSPQDIYHTLDKRYCKKILRDNDIRTTPMVDFKGVDFDDLIGYLAEQRISQVFIKPNFGSGAAGVIALKCNVKLNRYVIQTSISDDFANTKIIRKLTDKAQIARLVNYVLNMDYIIEKWIAKDDVSGVNYDLRVVYQFGRIDFIQVRGSKSNAITNLHLNNMPLDLESVRLSQDKLLEITNLCERAFLCFKGLKSVGFDILMEKNSRKPYIIEINAQGDLMYRDIYFENAIYKRQVEMMVNRWEEM